MCSHALPCITGVLTGEPTLTRPAGREPAFSVPFALELAETGRHAIVGAGAGGLLVTVGPLAERAYAQFTEGDRFIAVGQLLPAFEDRDRGAGVRFLVSRLGHDLAEHRYAVDRTRRGGACLMGGKDPGEALPPGRGDACVSRLAITPIAS